MVNLALRSVLHGWRRYLPVAVAVGVSGLLLVVQAALAVGAFRLAAAPVEMSSAALWVGPEDARAVDQSRGLSPFAASRLWLDPDIARIEPWRDPQIVTLARPGVLDAEGGTTASLTAIDVSEAGLALARAVTPVQRQALRDPGSVLLGEADAARLGLAPGDAVQVGSQPMRVAGTVPGLRAMFGVPLVASEATARSLGESSASVAFYLLSLRPGADPAEVAARLEAVTPAPEYRVWTAEELSSATVRTWAFDSGAGTMFLASAGMALGITLMIVSQTLTAAVASNLREYAALRATGIAFRSVQGIVLRQGLYVCLAALGVTALAAAGALAGLRAWRVPASLPPVLALALAGVLAAVVLASTLLAVRRLRRADPAGLLR